eukprot:7594337-Alexandrium_andersonii.AAC.1
MRSAPAVAKPRAMNTRIAPPVSAGEPCAALWRRLLGCPRGGGSTLVMGEEKGSSGSAASASASA